LRDWLALVIPSFEVAMPGPEISFNPPVRILLVRKGRDRIISTVSDASAFLSEEWPSANPYSRDFAKWVLSKALKGECTPHYARSVFICAAQEAEIYLGTYEEPTHPDGAWQGDSPATLGHASSSRRPR
jgi:hypothetical protein